MLFRGTLTTSPVAVCGTGSKPHIGTLRSYLRCYPTSTDIRVRLSYRDGDGPLKSKIKWSAIDATTTVYQGVVARYTDLNNWACTGAPASSHPLVQPELVQLDSAGFVGSKLGRLNFQALPDAR